MYISRIALDHFRSWNHLVFDCHPGINILYGANGLGKTNIVEAIEVMSTGTSHRTSSTVPLVSRGTNQATIRLNVHQSLANNRQEADENDTTTYELHLVTRGAKRARVNGGKSLYFRDIAGMIPSVLFTPRDFGLILGDPTERRTFLDQTASMLIQGYAQYIADFRHIAQQRTALLKTISDSTRSAYDATTLDELELWTGHFIESGLLVSDAREQTIRILSQYFSQTVSDLTSFKQQATLAYKPSFEELLHVQRNTKDEQGSSDKHIVFQQASVAISEHFQRLYAGEVARGCNLIGPQRDDMMCLLDGFAAKEFASNGEAWTLALALKIALYKALQEQSKQNPIMILDDVFAQLDEQRRQQIVAFAKEQEQVFITAASLQDIPQSTALQVGQLIDVASLQRTQSCDITTLTTSDSHRDLLQEVMMLRKKRADQS